MLEPVNVLICDDSAIIRKTVSKILSECRLVKVVGTAINGRFCLQKVEDLKPDLVLLDIEMPEMNGLEFLRVAKVRRYSMPIIIFSSVAHRGGRITMDALSLGAVDYVLKPENGPLEAMEESVHNLLNQVLIYGYRFKAIRTGNHEYLKLAKPLYDGEKTTIFKKKKVDIPDSIKIKAKELKALGFKKREIPLALPPENRPKRVEPPQLVVIGISTGGPNVLRRIIPFIPENLPLPIVIVQHMPEGFTREFAKSLNEISKLQVKEVEEGDVAKKGFVYIAPGDAHVKIQPGMRLFLDRGEPVNGHRPSADVLFESAARVTSAATVGIIMTGMGRDGALKLGDIYNCGGLTIAQNKESCVINGMPGTAVEYGYVDEVYSVEEILNFFKGLCQ